MRGEEAEEFQWADSALAVRPAAAGSHAAILRRGDSSQLEESVKEPGAEKEECVSGETTPLNPGSRFTHLVQRVWSM